MIGVLLLGLSMMLVMVVAIVRKSYARMVQNAKVGKFGRTI